jgi:hypothetical protein
MAALGLVLLAGCAQQPKPVSTTRVFAADLQGAARSCSVPNTTTSPGKESVTPMTVSNSGGWCAIAVNDNGRPYATFLLIARPAHGEVFVHAVGDATRIDYTPNRGYVGNDSFAVRLLPGDAIVRANVTVTAG